MCSVWGNVWGQFARWPAPNGWNSGMGCQALNDCDYRVAVPYNNNNTMSGTPATSIGTLPALLGSSTNYTLVFEDQFSTNNFLLKSQQASGQPFDYLGKIWRITDAGNLNSTDANFGTAISQGCTSLALRQDVTIVNGALTKDNFQTTAIKSMSTFRYGYMEARIRVPDRFLSDNNEKTGLFPAFWMRGGDGSSEVAEIDIFEMFQKETGRKKYYTTTLHYCNKTPDANGNFGATDQKAQTDIYPVDQAGVTGNYHLNLNKDFFVWGVRWTPTTIDSYFNNTFIRSDPNPFYPVNAGKSQAAMTIFLNCNVYQDEITSNTDFSNFMKIDYVRVYKDQSDFNTMLNDISQINGLRYCVGDIVPAFAIEEHLNNCTYSFSLIRTATNQAVPIIDRDYWEPLPPSGTKGMLLSTPLSLRKTPDHFQMFDFEIPANTVPGAYKVRVTVNIPAIGTQPATSKFAERTIYIDAAPPSVVPSITSSYGSVDEYVSFTPSTTQTGVSYMWGTSANNCTIQASSYTKSCNWNSGIPLQSGTVYMRAANGCGSSSSYSSKTYSLNCEICPSCPQRTVQSEDNHLGTKDSLMTSEPILLETNEQEGNVSKGENNNEFLFSSTLQLYPNPANKELHLISEQETGQIEIWNMQGEKVLYQAFDVGETLLHTEQLAEGLYQVFVITSTHTYPHRITLQH